MNHTYIKECATLRHWLRGALLCGVWEKVRERCVPALCAPALAVCGDVVRPQGGGGVDHPTKVQQRRVQIEILFTPWGTYHPKK